MNDELKYQIIAKLENGVSVMEIAEELDVGSATIYKIRREFDEAKVNGTIDQLVDVDKVMIEQLKDDIDGTLGIESKSQLVSGVEGLQRLDTEMQACALQLVQKLKKVMMSMDNRDEYIGDMKTVSSILCEMQTSFMNRGGTTVNIQNNHGEPVFKQFLSDKPANVINH